VAAGHEVVFGCVAWGAVVVVGAAHKAIPEWIHPQPLAFGQAADQAGPHKVLPLQAAAAEAAD